jgi:hypothetical protein
VSGRPTGDAWKGPETTYDDRLDDVRGPAWEEAAAASAAHALVAPDAPADDARPDEVAPGNLRRYARWQWKDFWQRRGFWLAGAALFGVWLLTRIAAVGGPRNGPMAAENLVVMVHIAFAMGGALAGLLGTGGLVARERERGLQRFLFAKPVNIVRYYLQGLTINSVGSLLVLAGALLLAALVLPGGLPLATVLGVAVASYALVSGVTFLLSTLLRFDAPLAAGWLLAGFPVVALAENGYWWGKVFQWLFPQGPMLAAAKSLMPNGPDSGAYTAEVALMLWLVAAVAAAYGAAAAAGGVAVLRRRSIQT